MLILGGITFAFVKPQPEENLIMFAQPEENLSMFDSSILPRSNCWLDVSGNTANIQLLLHQFLEKQSEQTILKSIEIDSDEHGKYRVWRDSQFLGTFHPDKKNDLWISQPCNYKLRPRFESSDDAVMFIIEMNALVAAA